MIINYIDAEIKFAQKGKVRQSVKLAEWANVEFENNKRSDIHVRINGPR
jgi:hypothetical protein